MNIFGGRLLGGKYRLESVLGEGGMGLVVEAMHVALGQRVAIKLLNPDAAQSHEAVQRFQREAQIAAQLRGDHITRVTDFGQTEDGRPFLVMELLEGRDLAKELLTRGMLPIEAAVDYVLQACKGVAEAHAAGLVHRDLKPANLFLTHRPDGSPLIKVLDFGLSKPRSKPGEARLTHARSKLGTIEYSSPEQIRSAKDVDARTDQHALGLILYELLTGRRPYKAATHGALSIIIATQEPPHPQALRPEIPGDLDAAVVRALAKDRRDRFSDVVEFARAIAPSGSRDAWATTGSIATTMASAEPTHPQVPVLDDGPVSGVGEDEWVTKLLRKGPTGQHERAAPRPAAGAPPQPAHPQYGNVAPRPSPEPFGGAAFAGPSPTPGGGVGQARASAAAASGAAVVLAPALARDLRPPQPEPQRERAQPPAPSGPQQVGRTPHASQPRDAAAGGGATQQARPGRAPAAAHARRPDMRVVLSVAFLAMVAAAVITFLLLATLKHRDASVELSGAARASNDPSALQ